MTNRDATWEKIEANAHARVDLLLAVADKLKQTKTQNAVSIAATEVFVEKAQTALTIRARFLLTAGSVFAGISAAVLAVTAWHLYTTELPKYLTEGPAINSTTATIFVIKTTTAGAIAIGLAVFFGRLAHAFLHEAMVLYSRRHALRFGRLFVYLNDGKVNFDELRAAFRWNDELSTGFKKMDMEVSTPFSKTLDAVKSAVDAIASRIK